MRINWMQQSKEWNVCVAHILPAQQWWQASVNCHINTALRKYCNYLTECVTHSKYNFCSLFTAVRYHPLILTWIQNTGPLTENLHVFLGPCSQAYQIWPLTITRFSNVAFPRKYQKNIFKMIIVPTSTLFHPLQLCHFFLTIIYMSKL
jgi:hypothetical protein